MKINVRVLRYGLFVAALVATHFLMPIPSSKTPDAKMAINTWANSISAKIAQIGFDWGRGDDGSASQVDGAVLTVVKPAGNEAIEEHLTFQYDNIVAIGVKCLLALAFYLFIVKLIPCKHDVVRKCLALLFGSFMFSLGFVVRDFLFGVYIADHPVCAVTKFDDPVRMALVFIMIVSAFALGFRTPAKLHPCKSRQ